MRVALRIPADEMVQFGRRRRELHAYYRIEKKRTGGKVLYIFRGTRTTPLDTEPINQKLRAQVLHAARGRCSMCGRTIQEQGITLQVDHKVPRNWGGRTELENLWATCQECNQGKKNLFASVDALEMRRALVEDSVHVRLGELLKAHLGKPVPYFLMESVAGQDDWKKRTRELRYLGWTIHVSKKKMAGGRVRSFYTLKKFTRWPRDPSGWIRRYEVARARHDRATLQRLKDELAVAQNGKTR